SASASWQNMDKGTNAQNGIVQSIDRYKDTVYAGGAFDPTYGSPAAGIMKWDGIHWLEVGDSACEGTAIDEGLIGYLTIIDTLLYVGGLYDTIGCLSTHGIATWNGSSWNNIGNFPNDSASGEGRVNRIIKFQNKIG